MKRKEIRWTDKLLLDSDGKNYDGVISSITLPNGKTYAIKAIVMEAFPLTCTKCGGKVTIKNGWGDLSILRYRIHDKYRLKGGLRWLTRNQIQN